MAKAGRIVAVVPAGGTGKRMGAGTPKQFLMLDGVPMKDTPKQAGPDGLIHKTLDRAGLWLAQTPQTFRRALVVSAYRKAALEHVHATDDAALIERLGQTVAIVQGSWDNMKITTPEDMVVAEAILAARKGRA